LGGDVKLQIAGTPGTTTGAPTDMKTDDAMAQLKQYRNKLYFPGTSAQALDTLEKVIGQLHVQERSHIGPVLTRKLQKLGDQLDRAERREGVRPQTPQSPATAPGRQSAAPGTPAGALIRTYEDLYRRIGPEEAEADLNETLTDPVKSRSPMAKAKLAAFANLNMRLPTETTLPEAPPPAPPAAAPAPVAAPAPATPVVAQPPAAAAPQPRATAPPQAPQTPRPQVAPRQAPLTPQAQALLARFVAAYNPLSDQDLDREEARLQSGAFGMDVLSQYRQKAIQIIRDRRTSPGGPLDQGPGEPSPMPGTQGTAPPVTRPPARTSKGQPQGLDQHNAYVAQYRDLTPQALQAEARRVLLRDPFSTSAESNFRLTALNQLLDERKAQKPHGELVDEPTLARYRTEVKDWSTARLMEQSSTLRGSIVAMLDVLAQARPEAFAAIDKAARLAREAHALGGGVASFPGAIAALPFAAPFVWGVALKSLATAFPEAAAAMKDVYHKQLAVGLELHERLQPRNAPSAADEAAD